MHIAPQRKRLGRRGAVRLHRKWNAITVSFRRHIVPDELLGRVNGVYRLFGRGMMPVDTPLCMAAGVYVILLPFAVSRLTTEKIEDARTAAGEPL